jgi:hypothetical protein
MHDPPTRKPRPFDRGFPRPQPLTSSHDQPGSTSCRHGIFAPIDRCSSSSSRCWPRTFHSRLRWSKSDTWRRHNRPDRIRSPPHSSRSPWRHAERTRGPPVFGRQLRATRVPSRGSKPQQVSTTWNCSHEFGLEDPRRLRVNARSPSLQCERDAASCELAPRGSAKPNAIEQMRWRSFGR